jgi:putative membrane protein
VVLAAALAAAVAASAAAVPREDGDSMQTAAEKFLSPEEKEKVTQAVRKAESLTSGEIVPMIVSSSYNYPLASVYGGVFLAFPLALLLAHPIAASFWVAADNVWLFLALFIPLYLVAHQVVKRVPFLRRLFVFDKQVEEEVREAAVTAFFSERLYKTKDENGILLFISVFERKVWVLADAGINAKIDTSRWQKIVDIITKGIKENRHSDSLCQAIGEVGDILKEHFPIQPDDVNELRNLIIR